jgi:hypothetical protein
LEKKVFFFGPFAKKKASSLKLTINDDFVVFLMLRVVMARGRKLKKVGGDLEIQKQSVASLKPTIGEQNVVPLER